MAKCETVSYRIEGKPKAAVSIDGGKTFFGVKGISASGDGTLAKIEYVTGCKMIADVDDVICRIDYDFGINELTKYMRLREVIDKK